MFVTDAEFGVHWNVKAQADEILWPLIRTKAIMLPSYSVQKTVTVNWPTQVVQSVLIIVMAGGLMWALRHPSPWSVPLPSAR